MINPSLDNIELSLNEYKRYSRHLLLPQVQIEGQKRLLQAKVLCVGAGGLGAPILLYLAASGIGYITIIDEDLVDISNLQRQVIHNTSYLNSSKVESAENYIQKLNPNCTVKTYKTKLNQYNITDLVKEHDIIVDGSDNLETRYLIDEFSYYFSKPWVYGAIFQFEGQVSVFNYQGGPSYRDIYPAGTTRVSNLSCAEGGVLGILPGLIGTLQATEALKILLGIGDILSGQLLIVNTLNLQFKKLKIRQNLDLPIQAKQSNYTDQEIGDLDSSVIDEVYLSTLLKEDLVTLIDVRSPIEFTIDKIPGGLNYPLQLFYNINTLKTLAQFDKVIVLYCSLDSRSRIASAILEDANIACKRLKNGIYAWHQKQAQQSYSKQLNKK
uniref:molybdopterin biosynthesis protein n=1 Tax=Tsunamia transpacifica TaxID=1935457 RepID=UPI001BEE35DA|nr:molybdopterin biosynthesis protein [Tsunamia transpacifica]QUE27907.1 moeB [Tsunamia transpacifica]UNJ14423.1 molybdopterin biosynthesis protein [Tsunamia transpacifica]